jgi:hypothetical protein
MVELAAPLDAALMAFLHHPVRRPFLEILAGFQLLSSVK